MRFTILLTLFVVAVFFSSVAQGRQRCRKPSASQKKKFFGKFTKTKTGCPCWFDLTKKKACACCNKGVNAMQCGWPMHNFCAAKSKKGYGCPGVCNNMFTLSQKGGPCFFDHSRSDCAWCTDNGYQCGPGKATGPESKDGSRCAKGLNKKYCDSVLWDCKHIPKYDVNARCLFKRSFGKFIQIFEPRCNPGYTGNGIQCFNKEGQLSVNPETPVEVKMKLKSDFYVYPHVDGDYSYGKAMEGLFKQGENALASCGNDKCQATYNQTEINF